MAGRAAQRPNPVAVLSLATVDDAAAQRAFDQLKDAVQELQVQIRQLRGQLAAVAAASGGASLADGDYGDVIVSGSGAVLTVDDLPESRILGLVADLAAKLSAARTLITTAPLTIGGGASADLSADRTFALAAHGVTAALMEQIPAITVVGNKTAGVADRAYLTKAEVLTMLGIVIDCGDGSDGSPVLDGTNTFSWASKSGSTYILLRSVCFDLPTITVGSTLKPDGYIICSKQPPLNNGTIDISGGSAAGTADAAAAVTGSRPLPVSLSSGTASSAAPNVFVASSAANGGVTAGGAGTTGADGVAGTLGRGGGGGAGGNNNPFTGQGASGGDSPAVALKAPSAGDIRFRLCALTGRDFLNALFTLGTWGAQGGNGPVGASGGGRGAAGGMLVISAPGIAGTGTLSARGGAGGPGDAGGPTLGGAGGGGGGAGGLIALLLAGGANTNSTNVAGGSGGSGGAGGAGGAGAGGNGKSGGDGKVLQL